MASSEDDIFSGLWNDYYQQVQQNPMQECLDSSQILTVMYPHGSINNSIRLFKKDVEPRWVKNGLKTIPDNDSIVGV